MTVERVNDWRMEDELARPGLPMVVLFSKPESPSSEKARRELSIISDFCPDAHFFEIDEQENPTLVANLGLTRTPATLVYLGGREVIRHFGYGLTPVLERYLGIKLSRD